MSCQGEHLLADIDPHNLASRPDTLRSLLSYRACSGAKVEDTLPFPQLRPLHQCLDDWNEPLIDLANVDIRDAIPNTNLPFEGFRGFRFRHIDSSTGLRLQPPN